MIKLNKKFKKVVVLDTVIFYPEHRKILNRLAEEVVEYPSSLPANLEAQYRDNPDLFVDQRCYTQIAKDNIPMQLLMQRIEGADVVISCWTDIPDDILRLNPQLKLVVFWTHEKEHRINVKLAEELGVTVDNIPDYGTEAVAEVTFAGMWQLLQRNYADSDSNGSEIGLMHAVMDCVFRRFRKLNDNEKNTRAGKFTHHFHKMGAAKFDFTQKRLDELIPERLIAHTRVGFFNIENDRTAVNALKAFSVITESFHEQDITSAQFYKFLCENDIVFYDSKNITPVALKKIQALLEDSIVDIRTLTSVNYDFNHRTFGIVGLGRIGTIVARVAKLLGFKVIYASRTRRPEVEDELGIRYVSLDELMKESDIVSVHLPAHHAENLIGADLIASLKPRSLFINTADGNITDQHALTDRMTRGEIYAYLDVYPGLPRKDILGLPMSNASDWKIHKHLPNHVIAYRAGWKTQESIRVKTYKLLGEMIDQLIKT